MHKKSRPYTGRLNHMIRIVSSFSLGLFRLGFSCRFCCGSRFSGRSGLYRFSGSAFLRTTGTCLLGHLIFCHILVVINQLYETHLGIVTQAMTCLDDAGITTRTVSDLHSYLFKEAVRPKWLNFLLCLIVILYLIYT